MIDLRPFCLTEPTAYRNLLKPFSQGNFTYATDGRIAVRVPRLPNFEEQDKPDLSLLFHKAEPKAGFLPLRLKIPRLEGAKCPSCDGTGKEHECPDCTCVCGDCDGTGVIVKEDASITIRGAIINIRHIRLIQGLPNARLAANPSPDGPAWFEFDGGDGLLMPMRRPFDRHIAEPGDEPAP